MPPPNLPTELVHMILDEVAEADGPRALDPMAPVSRTFRDICRPYTWKAMVIIPRLANALAEKLAVAPEITHFVQELYIDASKAQNNDWLRDPWPKGYGACLQPKQNWPKLRMLEINFFNWKALSARDQASLTALTQLPTFREFRATCVRDISFSIFAGFRGLKHLQLTSCSLDIDVDLQHLRCTAPTCSYLETFRISQHYSADGLEKLLNYITSEASPVNLTRLRALSFDPRCAGHVERPGLAQVLAVSSASLEVLKIEAGENEKRWRHINGVVDLSRMTALRSLMINCKSFERDILDFLISTLETVGPSAPLTDITIRTYNNRDTEPISRSRKWEYLDSILAQIRTLQRINIGIVPEPAFCECARPRCKQCTREKKYQAAIVDRLPRSAKAIRIEWVKAHCYKDTQVFWTVNLPEDLFLAWF